MFGFNKEEKLVQQIAGVIEGACDNFDMALAATTALLHKDIPEHGDKYLAILLGFADAAGIAANADMNIRRMALQKFLSSYSDGDHMVSRLMQVANDRQYFEWRRMGDHTILDAIKSRDNDAPMMILANAYLT